MKKNLIYMFLGAVIFSILYSIYLVSDNNRKSAVFDSSNAFPDKNAVDVQVETEKKINSGSRPLAKSFKSSSSTYENEDLSYVENSSEQDKVYLDSELPEIEDKFINVVEKDGQQRMFISSTEIYSLAYSDVVSLMDSFYNQSSGKSSSYTLMYDDFLNGASRNSGLGINLDRVVCGEVLCMATFSYQDSTTIKDFFRQLNRSENRLDTRASLLLFSEKSTFSENQRFAISFSTSGSDVRGFTQSGR